MSDSCDREAVKMAASSNNYIEPNMLLVQSAYTQGMFVYYPGLRIRLFFFPEPTFEKRPNPEPTGKKKNNPDPDPISSKIQLGSGIK